MALWSTVIAYSDQSQEFDRLMKDGIEGHEVTKHGPGVYIVHGPRTEEVLDDLAAHTGLAITTRQTDILDLE